MNSDSKKKTGNVYRDARLNAAFYDDRFNSREKTADLMNISSAQLMNYELGICKQIPPESVCMMAELYNAPELRSYYCHHQCPIGAIDVSPVYSMQLEGITLNILAEMNMLNKIKDRLIEIAADGQITEDEEEDFNKILKNLDGISQKAQELKVFAEKQRKKR
jgi:transcriptional regulator with XRE-family HTH domain